MIWLVYIIIAILLPNTILAEEIIEFIIEYNKGDISIISYTKREGRADINHKGSHILTLLSEDQKEIYTTRFDIPLLIDVPPDPDTGESYQVKVERNSTVVRLPYSPLISKVRVDSSIFRINSLPFLAQRPAPPTEVIVNSCPGPDCFDLVIVSDGYSDMNQFKADALAVANFFTQIEPYKSNLNLLRITRVDNTTSLDCFNNCNGIQRLICCDSSKVFSAVEGIDYDEILVITNTNEYGGSGYVDSSDCAEKGSYAVTFRDISNLAREVSIHETGHSFGGLWDEYEYGIDGSGDGPNCVHDPNCSIWSGTPGTGCYKGCSYNGMYRPTSNNCLMRTLSPTGGFKFCPVCRGHIEGKLKKCYSSCVRDCTAKECGDDGCGGSCGSCNKPPPDVCLDLQTLRDYLPYGSCNKNLCTYQYVDKKCEYICEQNRCISRPADAGSDILDAQGDEEYIDIDTRDEGNITDSLRSDSGPLDVRSETTESDSVVSDEESSGCSCNVVK